MKRPLHFLICAITIAFSGLFGFASSASHDQISHRLEVADSLHGIGKTDSAVIIGKETIRLAEKNKEPSLIVGAYAAQGVFLRSVGKINEALENYSKALDIITSGVFGDNPDGEAIEQIASLYINLAVLNLDMQHKEEAEKNAVLSGEWISKSSDPALKSLIYGAAGSVLTGCAKLEKALAFQKKAYQNALEAKDVEAAFRAAAYTMLIADRLGDKKEAQSMREICVGLMPEINSMMARLVYLQAECSIALKNDRPRDAVKWFNEILSLDGIDNLPFVKFDCYNNLHLAQASVGDYQDAYETLLKGNELRDSIWEKEKAENLRELTVKYETKETQLALAKSEAKRSRILMWLFISLAILLLALILFVGYIGMQRRLRLKREVEYANLRADIGKRLTQQYIEGLENERRRMSSELHDGVCNDLLAIQLNLSQGKSAETTAEMIENCRKAVRRISHELMPPEFEYASIDEVVRFYVRNQSEANKGKIEFSYISEKNEKEWGSIPDNVSLEIYRIIQEAVGNAVKHSGADRIRVSMQLNDDNLNLLISDNGSFKFATKKGLGIESIRRRASALGGKLDIKTEVNTTTISLSVKLK